MMLNATDSMRRFLLPVLPRGTSLQSGDLNMLYMQF